MSAGGGWSAIRVQRGRLTEYVDHTTPLELEFEFNPSTLTRTRTVTLGGGGAAAARGGYDFRNASESPRAAQGVSVGPESFTMKILLDATDRMNAGDADAQRHGIQPELDTIRSMLEPKVQSPAGARTLAALNQGDPRAFARQQHASVLLLQWGVQTLPVFMTQAQLDLREFLPSLLPYRAEATLTLQIIESDNPIYADELRRQFDAATRFAAGPRA